MPDATDYSDLAEFRDRLNLTEEDAAPDPMLQGILNTAARVVDAVSRQPPAGWPWPAFAESPPLTRYYPDPYMARAPEPVALDDLLTVTEVSRGGTVLTEGAGYLLLPYGADALPKTELLLAVGAGAWSTTLLAGRVNIAVTGTWGYCAADNRPPEIAEATLLQAVIFYQRYGLDVETLAQAVGDPLKAADRSVERMLWGVTRR